MCLHDFQKAIIEEKNKTEFEITIKENTFLKRNFSMNFRSKMYCYLDTLMSKGVEFYGFHIDFEEFTLLDSTVYWNVLHNFVEKFINKVNSHLELSEFIYVTIAKHENITNLDNVGNDLKGLPYLSGIVGIRSILGENPSLYLGAQSFFLENFLDAKLYKLTSVKDYWNVCVGNNNWKFHRMMNFSNFYDREYSCLVDYDMRSIDSDMNSLTLIYGGTYDNSVNSKIKGISTKNISLKIIYLISLYMVEQQLCLYDNMIFKKIKKSKYSWEYLDSVEFLKKNNIKIINYLKLKFIQQLDILDANQLLVYGFEKAFDIIKKNNHYLPQLNFEENVVEYNNGVYFIDYDYFSVFATKELESDRFFADYNEKVPHNWTRFLSNNFDDAENFCTRLASFFQCEKENVFHTNMWVVGDFEKIYNLVKDLIGVRNFFILHQENNCITICNKMNFNQKLHFVTKINETLKTSKSDVFFLKNVVYDFDSEIFNILVYCNKISKKQGLLKNKKFIQKYIDI